MATVYLISEAKSAAELAVFEKALKAALSLIVRRGYVGEFTVDKSGFQFRKAEDQQSSWPAPTNAADGKDDPYGDDGDDFDDADRRRSDVPPSSQVYTEVPGEGETPAPLDHPGPEAIGTINVNVDGGFDDCSEDEIFCSRRCARRCDGRRECENGEDERDCKAECSPDETICVNGIQCVRSEQWCDSNIDCDDRSDETSCGGSKL